MVMIVLALSICTILREVASVLSFILTSSLGSTIGVEGSLLALLLLVGVNSSTLTTGVLSSKRAWRQYLPAFSWDCGCDREVASAGVSGMMSRMLSI